MYLRLKKKLITLDCCGNPDCTGKKAKQVIKEKYEVDSIRKIDFVNEKIKKTNIERYGCENPFGNKEVQEKIKKYYLENFGVEHNMQISECINKAKRTCLNKYGVENYTKTEEFRNKFRGENSPVWKGEKSSTIRDGRELPEYRDWRKSIFDRDLYTCQCCGARNGNGKYIRLEAHHIKNWKDNIELRYDTDNGITLCQQCHLLFHSKYGKRNNTIEQLNEFIQNNIIIDKNIC